MGGTQTHTEGFTVTLERAIPSSVTDLLREVPIELDGEDLLPVLSTIVHDIGKRLHCWGGTDGRPLQDGLEALKDARTAVRVLEVMIAINEALDADEAERTAAREARMQRAGG